MENSPNPTPNPPQEKRSLINSILVGAIGLASGVYLCFPGSAFVRAFVEVIPVVGQFDEAAAAALLFSCLSYFGINLTNIFSRSKQYEARRSQPGKPKTVEADFVER